jgi:SAM-dependent methyltransferase
VSIDFHRTTPFSRVFGFDRGTPVDRRYIDGFLARYASDIHGRVLEIKDDAYTRHFGGGRVITSTVLDIDPANPRVTLVDDLTSGTHIPSNAFDCVILTQTLQLIFDVRAALRTVHRILAPGGVALITVPGITQIPRDEAASWFWSFTDRAMQRLCGEAFAGGSVEIEVHGNVLAATAFLHGLALHELREDELDVVDPDYPVIITARAAKRRASS